GDGGGHRGADRSRAADGARAARCAPEPRSAHRRRGGSAMSRARETRVEVRDPAAFGKVAVMLGGRSSEREVSLETGHAVLRALRSRGVAAEPWDPAERDWREFVAADFD